MPLVEIKSRWTNKILFSCELGAELAPETNSASRIALEGTEEAIAIRDFIRASAPSGRAV